MGGKQSIKVFSCNVLGENFLLHFKLLLSGFSFAMRLKVTVNRQKKTKSTLCSVIVLIIISFKLCSIFRVASVVLKRLSICCLSLIEQRKDEARFLKLVSDSSSSIYCMN